MTLKTKCSNCDECVVCGSENMEVTEDLNSDLTMVSLEVMNQDKLIRELKEEINLLKFIINNETRKL